MIKNACLVSLALYGVMIALMSIPNPRVDHLIECGKLVDESAYMRCANEK